MKRTIILLLLSLAFQAGHAISIDRFFKKYKRAAGIEYQAMKNVRAELARQMGVDPDTDISIDVENDTLLDLQKQTFQQALGTLLQADLKNKESIMGLRQVQVTQAVEKTVKAMSADLKALEIGSDYEEVFSAQGANGSWHIYLKEVGPFYEVLAISTETVALALITGIKKSSLNALLKHQKK